MKVYWIFPTLIFLCSCHHHQNEPYAFSSQQNKLIASLDVMTILRVSDQLTEEDIDRLERFYPKTMDKLKSNHTLQLQDVVNMTKAGVADEMILVILQTTKSHFSLTHKQTQVLQRAGVSQRVIEEMQGKYTKYQK